MTDVPPVSRILVTTDLSARSDRAIERAVLLSDQTGAALTALHVVDADLPGRIADRQADEARELIAEHIATLQKGRAEGRSGACEVRVVFGRDHGDILDVAQKIQAELVVLGMHRSESREHFRGTTAHRVMSGGAAPTLLVKDRPRGPYRRALVAVDFSDCSQAAVRFAARLLPDAELHLVHAFEVPYKALLGSDGVRREVAHEHEADMTRFVEEDCADVLAAAVRAKRLFPVVRQGDVHQVVSDQVDRLRPDLLVVGTHGRSGLAYAALGSKAEDLLSRPPCDVLAVKP